MNVRIDDKYARMYLYMRTIANSYNWCFTNRNEIDDETTTNSEEGDDVDDNDDEDNECKKIRIKPYDDGDYVALGRKMNLNKLALSPAFHKRKQVCFSFSFIIFFFFFLYNNCIQITISKAKNQTGNYNNLSD